MRKCGAFNYGKNCEEEGEFKVIIGGKTEMFLCFAHAKYLCDTLNIKAGKKAIRTYLHGIL